MSPLNVLAAIIAPKIDELLHSDEYIKVTGAGLRFGYQYNGEENETIDSNTKNAVQNILDKVA
ncbi:MAG: hypothetical protein K2H13_09845 [Eubacterium sp.]|nr:hypothetical protein [Eubacterium sp.]MDE6767064.1 hypothetical protein [Eubacterium sp.]